MFKQKEKIAGYRNKSADPKQSAIAAIRSSDMSAGGERETITPSEDVALGINANGENLYERADGSRYRIHNGKPDFGGDLITQAVKAEQPASTTGVNITTGMSTNKKIEILGHLVRGKIVSSMSFQKLLAAAKLATKSIHGKVADDYDDKAMANPWDLLTAHSGILNAKSVRATTLRSLADAVIREAKLPMMPAGNYRGMDYSINWDRLAKEQPATNEESRAVRLARIELDNAQQILAKKPNSEVSKALVEQKQGNLDEAIAKEQPAGEGAPITEEREEVAQDAIELAESSADYAWQNRTSI